MGFDPDDVASLRVLACFARELINTFRAKHAKTRKGRKEASLLLQSLYNLLEPESRKFSSITNSKVRLILASQWSSVHEVTIGLMSLLPAGAKDAVNLAVAVEKTV